MTPLSMVLFVDPGDVLQDPDSDIFWHTLRYTQSKGLHLDWENTTVRFVREHLERKEWKVELDDIT